MPKIPRPRRAVWLAALCAAGPVSSAGLPNLLLGRDTCAANFSRCTQAGLPDNFCCPNGQTCNILAANTTVLCCPNGADCSQIQPISCDITQQDPRENPKAVVKTTVLNGIMTHCGDGTCCPFGYLCNTSGQCSKSPNQDALPFTATSSSPTASSTTTGAAKSTASANTNNAASSAVAPQGASTSAASASSASASESSTSGDSGPQPAVIAGAAIGAAFVGILAALVAYLCIKRRKAKKREDSENIKSIRSTSSFGNIISNPIMTEDATMRSDFTRRSPGARASTASSFATRVNEDLGRIGGDFYIPGTTTPTPDDSRRIGVGSGTVKVPPIRNMRQSSIAYGYGAPDTSPYNGRRATHTTNPYAESVYPEDTTASVPQTPKNREPSSMSIPLYTDERTLGRDRRDSSHLDTPSRRRSRDTTISDVLRQVALDDVANGKAPFVPPSAYSPASRR